jgi:hypothetical protein
MLFDGREVYRQRSIVTCCNCTYLARMKNHENVTHGFIEKLRVYRSDTKKWSEGFEEN